MQTYFISFQDLDFGQGYALSLLITVVTLLVSLLIVARRLPQGRAVRAPDAGRLRWIGVALILSGRCCRSTGR